MLVPATNAQLATGEFEVKNNDTITALVPAAATTGSVDVTVTTASTLTAATPTTPASTTSATSPIVPGDAYTYVAAAPGASGAPPLIAGSDDGNGFLGEGPQGGGGDITLTGSNLEGATAVNFGSVAGTIVPNSSNTSTQLEVAVPQASLAGSVDVTVTTGAGTSAVSPYDVYFYEPGSGSEPSGAPTVSNIQWQTTSVAASNGPPVEQSDHQGGTLEVNGTNFTSKSTVLFLSDDDGGTYSAGTTQYINSSTQLLVTPPTYLDGATDVIVENSSGESPVNLQDVLVSVSSAPLVPVVTSVSSYNYPYYYYGGAAQEAPAFAPSNSPNAYVEVSGENLSDITSAEIDGQAATIISSPTADNVVVKLPTSPAGLLPQTQSTVTSSNNVPEGVGNALGMLQVQATLPASFDAGTVTITAPTSPRPASVPSSAPWGTVFPTSAYDTDQATQGYSQFSNISGNPYCYSTTGEPLNLFNYGVCAGGSGLGRCGFPGQSGISVNPSEPNQVSFSFSFSLAQNESTANVLNLWIANVVNPVEGAYDASDYTITFKGSDPSSEPASTTVAAPATNPNGPSTLVFTSDGQGGSPLTSTLTSSTSSITATNNPSSGAVLTATINDAYYNPISGDSVYIGTTAGDQDTETIPAGTTSGSVPTTDSTGSVTFDAFGTEVTTACNPDTFFAEDVTSGHTFYLEGVPPPLPDGCSPQPSPFPVSEGLVPLNVVASTPEPPSAFSPDQSNSSRVEVASDGCRVSRVLPQSGLSVQTCANDPSLPLGEREANISITLYDQFGNPVADQAVLLEPIPPAPPQSEELGTNIATSWLQGGTSNACLQGEPIQLTGEGCTNESGQVTFVVSDALAQTVQFEVDDATDGVTFPTSSSADAVNIPIVQFLTGPTSTTRSTVLVDGSSSATVLADGSTATVTATLTDDNGNPEVGKTVCLQPQPTVGTHSTISGTTSVSTNCAGGEESITDSDGHAKFSISDTTVESVTYGATDVTDGIIFGAAQQLVSVSFVEGTVSTSNSTVCVEQVTTCDTSATVVGDGQGAATVTVTVRDDGDHLLDGETVALSTPSWPTVTVVPADAVTNSSGTATFTVRSSSPLAGSVAIPVVVSSFADPAGVTLAAAATLDFVRSPSTSNSSVTATFVPTDSTTCATGSTQNCPEVGVTGGPDVIVSADVLDGSQSPAPIAGLVLSLVASGGCLSARVTSITTTTGVASFPVEVTDPHCSLVHFTVVDESDNGSPIGEVVVQYVPIPDEAHESTVTPGLSTLDTQKSAPITVTLRTGDGTPISGDCVVLLANVTVTVTPTSTQTCWSGDGAVTNPSGVATFSVSNPPLGNPADVTLTAYDVTPSTPVALAEQADVDFLLAPEEDVYSTMSSTSSLVEANGTSSTVVTVTLLTRTLESPLETAPMVGDTVSLTDPHSHARIIAVNPVSNDEGQAQFVVSDLVSEAAVLQATDLSTGTILDSDVVITFSAPPGGSLQPTVTSVSPDDGPGSGGNIVTIDGTNLLDASAVYFGTAQSPTFSVNLDGTQMLAVAPIPIAAGTVDVTVTGPGGTSTMWAADNYTYDSQPPVSVESITPNHVALGQATTVTIKGTGMLGAINVKFGSTSAPFQVVGDGGQIEVRLPASSSPGRVPVQVTAGFGSSPVTSTTVFTYVGAAPVVTPIRPGVASLGPTNGPLRGGTKVTITGRDLSRATRVLFANRPGTQLRVNASGTKLTVISPRGRAAGRVLVRIIFRGTVASLKVPTRFRYTPLISRARSAPKGAISIGTSSPRHVARVPT